MERSIIRPLIIEQHNLKSIALTVSTQLICRSVDEHRRRSREWNEDPQDLERESADEMELASKFSTETHAIDGTAMTMGLQPSANDASNLRDGAFPDNSLPPRPHTSSGVITGRNPMTGDDTDMAAIPTHLKPKTSTGARHKRPGELTAACMMWDRMSQPQTPSLRQCLTYAEIYRNREEEHRLILGTERRGMCPGEHSK